MLGLKNENIYNLKMLIDKTLIIEMTCIENYAKIKFKLSIKI